MALWARLYEGDRANAIFKGYIAEQAYPQLFAKCGNPLQIDGTMGVAAGITEMLVQSHEDKIHLLPALPAEWGEGSFEGVCDRGGFELSFRWESGKLRELEILSKAGAPCVLNYEDKLVEFDTEAGQVYKFDSSLNSSSIHRKAS
jgi:alpha-L-fucosidase 2